ncbi:MAG TPA: flippase-like domain-containing protein [Synergistaceae bacterium]|nr:flippase-like domain-containing protein [Synergistaceae bacterium]HPJ25688.1 flippase-like domain-containing protein [Synergistaceae bacterium]HPQ37633.1 flippase-like domain-containing protein [Synergistaceae bacterium]
MSLRKGLAFFLGLSLLVSFVVLGCTVDASTVQMLLKAKKSALFMALGIMFCAWTCDAARFILIARAAEEKLSFRLGILLTWLNYFGCAITPMQGGGGPFQVFILYKNRISIGKGVAITLTRTLLTLFLLGFVVPISIFTYPELLQGRLFLKGIFFWVAFFVTFSWVVISLSIFRPKLIKRFAGAVVIILNRIGFLKRRYIICAVRRVYGEIDEYNKIFRLFFSTGKIYFMWAIFFSCLHLLCFFSVLPCLIWGLGLPVHFGECVVIQAMFMFLLYFVPTPGASGVAEGGGAALFKLLVPWNLAGVMAISWRFFTEYLAIFMGGIVAVKLLGWGGAEKLLQGEEMRRNACKEI